MALPALGVFSYNGFTFNEKCWTEATARFLYDQAERTVVATVWTITAHQMIVLPIPLPVDTVILNARQLLSKPGQQLIYIVNGFGGLQINTAQQKDVMWGPKPKVLTLRRVGSSQAVEIIWQCEVAIPECTNASYVNQLMALNYKIRFDIDREGLTTRQITGYYEIPMTRSNGGPDLPDHAENYWNNVFNSLTIPAGFDQIINSREFSEDKRRCDFVIVHKEIPGSGYPPNTTSFNGVHRLSVSFPNFYQFSSTVSATYVVAKGISKQAALDAFFLLVQDRYTQAGTNSQPIFSNFEIAEGLGDNRQVSLSLTWTFMTTITNCIVDAGLFRPIPGTDWITWIASAGIAAAKGARGEANILTGAGDDTIIDLCQSSSLLVGQQSSMSVLTGNQSSQASDSAIVAQTSWLAYHCDLETDQHNSKSILKSVGTERPPTERTGGAQSQMQSNTNSVGVSGLDYIVSLIASAYDPGTAGQITVIGNKRLDDIIQDRAPATYRILLKGMALRAGFQIPYPSLLTYMGQTCRQLRARTRQSVVANWSGVPINMAEWAIEYIVGGAPVGAGIPVVPNPAFNLQ